MLRRAARGEGPPDLTTRATRAGSAAARAPDQDRRTTAPIAPAEAPSQQNKAPHGFCLYTKLSKWHGGKLPRQRAYQSADLRAKLFDLREEVLPLLPPVAGVVAAQRQLLVDVRPEGVRTPERRACARENWAKPESRSRSQPEFRLI